MRVDRLIGLIGDVASASGVTLRGPIRGRVVFGCYESQVLSRGTVAVECLNAHGEYELLVGGSEAEVYAALTAMKRLYDIGLQMRFRVGSGDLGCYAKTEGEK
jgi:hypothetical protein